ncbi:MAG: AsmA-like C-terminal domain-containing protein, partial [Campylobacterota bacterium]|nr:AsmA-like C-terminal domain-containing protein [Campylobacterota bacterium]
MLKKIVSVLGVLILIVLMFFFSLMYGIKIDNISYKSIHLNGLYLKYDKKLILTLDKIAIKPKKEQSKTKFNPYYISFIDDTLKYFKYIKIDNLIYNKRNIFLEFKNNIFIFKDKELGLNLSTELNYNQQNHGFNIKNLKIKYLNKPIIYFDNIFVSIKNGKLTAKIDKTNNKDYLTFNGNIVFYTNGKYIDIDGIFSYKDCQINTKLKTKKQIVYYDIYTNQVKNINIFEDFVKFPKELRVWIIDNLKIKNVKINNANGKIYLKDFSIDFSTLKVDAVINNAILDFNPKTSSVKSQKVFLKFNGKDLKLEFTKPFYNDLKLDGTVATIYDILGDSGLLLNIKSTTPLNSTLRDLILSYDVTLPTRLGLIQTKGKSDLICNIDIPFNNNPIDLFVNIKNTDSVLKIKDKDINIKNIDFTYKENKVTIKSNLYFDNLNLNFINRSKLKENKIDGTIDIKSLNYKDTILVSNKVIPYKSTYKETLNIFFPEQDIYYKNDENNNSIIDINRLSNIDKYIPKYTLPKGKLKLKTKNFNNFLVELKTDISSYGVYYKNNKIKDIIFNGDIKDMKTITIIDNVGLSKSTIQLRDKPIIDITFNNMKYKYIDNNESKNLSCKNKTIDLPKINLNLNNGSIDYNNKLIKYKKLNIKTKDDKIDINLSNKNTRIKLNIQNKDIYLYANNIDTEFINNFFRNQVVDSGTIDLDLKGTQCLFGGEIKLNDLNIKEAHILNQILLVVNSAPSLINPLLIVP